jgi:dihydroxyacetone kinase
MKAGMITKDKTSLTLTDLVAMLRTAMEGMMARGGAELGDKTLLDALAPAAEKIEEWSHQNSSDIWDALQTAADAASEAAESTRGWIAKRGRQYFTGERSIGTLDPGMVAVATMMQAVAKALKDAHA